MLLEDAARMLSLVQDVNKVHFSWLGNHRHICLSIGLEDARLSNLIRGISNSKLQERSINVVDDVAVRSAVRVHLGASKKFKVVELGIDSDDIVAEMLVDMLFMAHFRGNATVGVCVSN